MHKVIELKQVSKKFTLLHERELTLRNTILGLGKRRPVEDYWALKDVSFTVDKGEFIGIIGRNGSGKSVLLKIIAGIYPPSEGELFVAGKILPFLELGFGSNVELSGRDNIFLQCAILGLRRSEIKIKYDDIVCFAGLDRYLDQKIKKYSTGMQLRLAFAVSIQVDASIFLIDEVLAIGDGGFQKKCEGVFLDFKKRGKTVIYVSHDLNSIEKWCNRTIWLHEGNLVANGNTREVIQEYVKGVLVKNGK